MSSHLWGLVRSAPRDDRPRLVLADALMAEGDPLGLFITLQCQQAVLGPRFAPDQAAALRELWAQQGPTLLARFGDPNTELLFERGLPASMACPVRDFLARPPPSSVVRLELDGVQDVDLPKILRHAEPLSLVALRLRPSEAVRWAESALEVLGGAELPALEHLGLFHAPEATGAFERFLRSPMVRKLRSLELGPVVGDPLLWLGALPSLEELSVNDYLPASSAPLLARHGSVSFRSQGMQPGLAEALGSQPVWLPWTDEPTPRHGGPTVGRWQSISPVGARPGLDATLVCEATTRLPGLMLRTQRLSAEYDGPRSWFDSTMRFIDGRRGSLGPIDVGLHSSGEWAVFAITHGERLDRLYNRRGTLGLSAEGHAAAWAPIAELVAQRAVTAPSLVNLFADGRGIQAQPGCAELDAMARLFGPPDVLGVLGFSPEAVRGLRFDERHNSWALAVQICLTLGLEVLPSARTSRPDFHRQQVMMEVLSAIAAGAPFDLSPHPLPEDLHRILQRCLVRDPNQRASPRELAGVLRSFESSPSQRLAVSPVDDAFSAANAQAEHWLNASSIHARERT